LGSGLELRQPQLPHSWSTNPHVYKLNFVSGFHRVL